MDKMRMESPDMTAQNVDRIAALFPNCVTEVLDEEHSTPEKKVYKRAINFELLKQMLSPDVVEGNERYEFTWVGKKAAIVEANQPIRKTLRPCKEESKDWDTTENLYIEGDNLEVLKLLQESYLGKVKMIYIDPPYNTGNDFIYADDFMHSQEQENQQMGMYDEDENRLFKNTDITYNMLDEHYDTDIFTEPTIKGKLGTNAMKAQRHLYDHIVYDSTNERNFAADLDTDTDVAVYVKLPDSFYIATPVGHYNPDWAIAFYEGAVKHIYFVAETKGAMSSMQLRLIEESKIHCAREHFKAISNGNVVYDVVDSYQALPEKVMK